MKKVILVAATLLVLSVSISQGAVSPSNETLLRKIESRAIETGSDSLVILQNDKIVYQNNFQHPDQLQSVQSITKSICSVAIAILMDRGAIRSVEQPMSTWIPEWSTDPLKSQITLRMIMTQTSGLPNDPAITDAPDRIAFAKHESLVANPGEKFIYSGVGSSLLQVVISKASGQSVEDFVAQNIFRPLSISSWNWAQDKAGHEATGGGLFLLPSDLVKLGQMMLADGRYHQTRIVSHRMHDLMLTKTQNFADYGLLWWLKKPGTAPGDFREYLAAGWGGQFVVVLPEKHLIAVRTRDPKGLDDAHEGEVAFGEFAELIGTWDSPQARRSRHSVKP